MRYVIVFAVLGTVSIAGCGAVDRVLDQFSKAIEEVRQLRLTIQTQSREWQKLVTDSQTRATEDLRLMIKEDFADLTQNAIEEAGIQVMCIIDFAESKILTYLKALEDALVSARKQIEETRDVAP